MNCIEQLKNKQKQNNQKNHPALAKTLQGLLIHLPTPESIDTM